LKYVTTLHIGGVRQVGFSPNSDLLLIITSSGAGLFNCKTGERVAREHDYTLTFEEEVSLLAKGIGSISNQIISVAGLHGGGFRTMTLDGWRLEVQAPHWPKHDIYLISPWQPARGSKDERVTVATDGVCELRAYGFSDTGQTFIVATSCDIQLFAREN
jgi:hypothetical protein